MAEEGLSLRAYWRLLPLGFGSRPGSLLTPVEPKRADLVVVLLTFDVAAPVPPSDHASTG